MEVEKQKRIEDEIKKSQIPQQNSQPVKAPEPKPYIAQENIEHPLLRQLEQEKEIQSKVKLSMNNSNLGSAPKEGSSLPSLAGMKGGFGLGYKKMPEIESLQKRREELASEIEKNKETENKQALEERKKRILEQREKMQEQKRAEREAQLTKYEEIKTEVEAKNEIKVSDGEKSKRKQIYDMLRE